MNNINPIIQDALDGFRGRKTINVKDQSRTYTGFYENGRIHFDCDHPYEGLFTDDVDMGDDGDGYIAYSVLVCGRCGHEVKDQDLVDKYLDR